MYKANKYINFEDTTNKKEIITFLPKILFRLNKIDILKKGIIKTIGNKLLSGKINLKKDFFNNQFTFKIDNQTYEISGKTIFYKLKKNHTLKDFLAFLNKYKIPHNLKHFCIQNTFEELINQSIENIPDRFSSDIGKCGTVKILNNFVCFYAKNTKLIFHQNSHTPYKIYYDFFDANSRTFLGSIYYDPKAQRYFTVKAK